MLDDWLGLILFIAVGLLSLINMRRGRKQPDPDGHTATEAPPPAFETTLPEEPLPRPPERVRTGPRPPAPRATTAAGRHPSAVRRSTHSARQAMIAIAVFGPCRAEEPYPEDPRRPPKQRPAEPAGVPAAHRP